jgi:hypothetical protein
VGLQSFMFSLVPPPATIMGIMAACVLLHTHVVSLFALYVLVHERIQLLKYFTIVYVRGCFRSLSPGHS